MRLIFRQLLSYFPTRLPVGMTQMLIWMDEISSLAGDFADKDSMRYAIASNLIHLPHTKAKVPKAYFVNTLRKAAANQVASQIFHDIKTKQAEAAAKQQLEAEATAKAVADEPKSV